MRDSKLPRLYAWLQDSLLADSTAVETHHMYRKKAVGAEKMKQEER
jgi:hypothetical protein